MKKSRFPASIEQKENLATLLDIHHRLEVRSDHPLQKGSVHASSPHYPPPSPDSDILMGIHTFIKQLH